jgi:hypothetical protein
MTKRSYASEVASDSPRRLAVLWMPNGVRADQWSPEREGADYDLSPSLRPLDKCKNDVSVFTNLWHQNTDSGDGHYVKCSGFLTGTTIHKTVGVDLNANGVSMDQVVASAVGKHTPLPSLELGTEPVRTGVDKVVGYTRVYGAHISWRTPTVPLAKEINPRLAFERLFRIGKQSSNERDRNKLLLDTVMQDAKSLDRHLGASDKRKLEEYLESVRSIEARIAKLDSSESSAWKPLVAMDESKKPESDPASHEVRVRLMLDIMAMAFQSDITRVSTFMFGNSVSDISFSFLDGVEGSHHSLSHHEKDENKLRQYQKINEWHVGQFVYFIDRLRNMSEGESNVLNNSLVLFGAGLRDGNSHSPRNLPILLGGNAGGRINSGKHFKYEPDTPLCNLYLSMLNALDVPMEKFADSTEHLPGVLADVA